MSNKRKVSIMKIAICDDEKYIRDFMKACIANEYPDEDILCYESAESLLKSDENADIVLLDIQMNGIDGMELAKQMRANGSDAVIIFVTALEEYVFNAFDVRAFNYLVKPIDKDKFNAVLHAAVDEKSRKQTKVTLVEPDNKSFMIKANGLSRSVSISEIAFAEVFNRRIVLHMKDNDVIEYYGRMTDLERIAGGDFFRVHRAYLINLTSIQSYNSKVVMVAGVEIPVARGKYQDLVRAYLSFNTRGL